MWRTPLQGENAAGSEADPGITVFYRHSLMDMGFMSINPTWIW